MRIRIQGAKPGSKRIRMGLLKDAQATGEAFSPQKRTSSTSKHEILYSFFVIFSLLDPGPDLATSINADPDLQPWTNVKVLAIWLMCVCCRICPAWRPHRPAQHYPPVSSHDTCQPQQHDWCVCVCVAGYAPHGAHTGQPSTIHQYPPMILVNPNNMAYHQRQSTQRLTEMIVWWQQCCGSVTFWYRFVSDLHLGSCYFCQWPLRD